MSVVTDEFKMDVNYFTGEDISEKAIKVENKAKLLLADGELVYVGFKLENIEDWNSINTYILFFHNKVLHKIKINDLQKNIRKNPKWYPTCKNHTIESVTYMAKEFCKKRGDIFKYVVEFKGNLTKVAVECKCGHGKDGEWVQLFTNMSKRQCPKCATKNNHMCKPKLSQEEMEKHVGIITKNRFHLLEPFKNKGYNTKIKLVCNTCYHGIDGSWTPTISNISKIDNCPECNKKLMSEKYRLNQNDVSTFVDDLISRGYKLNEPFVYKNLSSRVSLRCKCGHGSEGEWTPSFSQLYYRRSDCPSCYSGFGSESKLIGLYIDPQLGNFQCEKRFADLGDNKYRYDRYVKDKNILLEFDHVQHFDKSNKWYTDEGVERDRQKTNYAIKNGFNFIRVAYNENVTETVSSFLKLVKENPTKQIIQIYGKVYIS